jgi:hypothetical protein
MIWLFALLVVLIIIYVALIRPILRRLAFLSDFWKSVDAAELGWFGKLQVLFDGIKIKLLSRLIYVPGMLVGLYDYATTKLAGLDLAPVTSKIDPTWMLGGTIAIGILIDFARSYSGSPVTPDDHVIPPPKV